MEDEFGFKPIAKEEDDFGFKPVETQEDDFGFKPVETQGTAPPQKEITDVKKGDWTTTQAFSPDEVKAIAKKHGVDESFVESWINWSVGETKEQQDAEASMETTKEQFLWGKEGEIPLITTPAGKVALGTIDRVLGHIPSSLINSVTKDDNEKKAIDDIREMASKKLSRIGDVALGVGMLGGGAGTIGATRTAAKTAAEGGRLIKTSKFLESGVGTALSGGVLGAAYGAGESKTGEALDDAAKGFLYGLGGGVIGSAVERKLRKKALDDVGPTAIKKFWNDAGVDADELMQEAKKENKLLLDNLVGYARGDKDVVAKIDAAYAPYKGVPTLKLNHEGRQLRQIKQKAKSLKRKGIQNNVNIEEELLADLALKKFNQKTGGASRIKQESDMVFSVMDNLPISKVLDAKYGTSVETALRGFSTALNKNRNLEIKVATKLKNLRKENPATPVDVDIEGLIGKSVNKMTDAEKGLKKLIDDIHDEVSTMYGVKLEKTENFYVPRLTKKGDSLLGSLQTRLDDLDIPLTETKTGWTVDAARVEDALKRDPDLEADISFLRKLTQNDESRSADKVIEDAFDLTGGVPRTDKFDSKRLMERDLEDIHIPEWAIETNVDSIVSRYARELATEVGTAKQFTYLNFVKRLAKKSGDTGTEKWLDDLVKDQLGSTRGFTKALSRAGNKLSVNAMLRHQKNPNTKDKVLMLLPHAMNMVTRLAYPSLLSKPISFTKNLASPFFSTMPYLVGSGVGAREALNITTQAMMDSVQQLVKIGDGEGLLAGLRNLRRGEAEVLERGLIPGQFTGEMAAARDSDLIRGLKNDSGVGKFFKGMEGAESVLSDTLLYAFQTSENIARVMSKNMAIRLSEKMAARPGFANKILNTMDSPAMRRKWFRSVPSKDSPGYEDFKSEMIEHINQNTMFNYDRVNMSSAGRSLGPLFSQFSKWPTMMLGKTVTPFMMESNKDAMVRATSTLIAPLLGALAANESMKAAGVYEDPRYKVWVGDLTSYTPISAITSVFTRDDSLRPPVVKLFTTPLKAILGDAKGKSDALQAVWDFTGPGGIEKAYGSAVQTITGKKFEYPSRKFTREIGRSLKDTLGD